MSYSINITSTAKDDLRKIYEYIAFDLQSPQAAENLLDRLESRIEALNDMPERFRLYGKEPWKSRNLRIMPVENYLVFYIPDSADCTVTVIRVLYGGRDTEKLL